MKNYKKIRQKPYIYGFSIIGFFVFAIGLILSLAIILFGVSLTKLIIAIIMIGLFYLVGKGILSNERILSKFLDNKLPKNYSEYE